MASLRSDRDEPTVVTAGMHISGNLMSEGDVRIEGCVEGDVQSPKVLIAEEGSVLGSVFADEVIIRGGVNGHVHARLVTLAETAQVALDITYIEITIEPGAEIEGRLMPVASLEQLLRIPPPRLPPPQSSAVISGSGSAVLDPVWAARPDPASRAVSESQMTLWPGPEADCMIDAGGGLAPGLDAEGWGRGSRTSDAPGFGPDLVLASAAAPAFELDADTMLEEPRASEAAQDTSPVSEPQTAPVPSAEPGAEAEPGDARREDKPNGAAARTLTTALGFEIDAEPFVEADNDVEPVQVSTTAADYIPAATAYPLADRPGEPLPTWKRPPVAVPITLQARDVRPRRRYTALAAAALLLLVAGSGLYLGARGIYETEFGVGSVEVADASGSGGDQKAETTDAKVSAPEPPGQQAAATAPVQSEEMPADAEDARIQAAIEAKRKEMSSSVGETPGAGQAQGNRLAAQDAVREPSAAAGGVQPSASDATLAKAVEREAGELSAPQQAEDYVPPDLESIATVKPDADGQESGSQVAARGDGKPARAGLAQAIDDFKAGMAASGRDDFDETIARLSPAIASGKLENENLAAAYRNRARAFASKGSLEKAITDYGETIKLLPGDPSAYNSRGYIYNKRNMPREAVADISKAIKLMPSYSFAYSNRCWAYRKLGRREEAIADCRKALELNPRLDFARKSLERMGVQPAP